jgi:DNA-binding transcriptional LysR family regulator
VLRIAGDNGIFEKCILPLTACSKKMNKYSLRTLRTFVTVAGTGSISAAALKLGRSQASVSTTISEFEKALGAQIFLRKPAKGLVLTATGEMLDLEARGLLAHADEFESIAGAMGDAMQGELSVACFVNLAPFVFTRLVAEFGKQYPNIKLRVLIGDHEEVLESLRSGVTEVALTFDLAFADQFRPTNLAALPPQVLLSARHRLANEKELHLADLSNEPYVLMDLPHTREYILSLFYSLHIDPIICFRSTSFEAVRTFVGNGLGYALENITPHVSETYDGGHVVSIALADNLRPLQITFVTLRRIAQRRVVRTFSEFTRGFFKIWREENSIVM